MKNIKFFTDRGNRTFAIIDGYSYEILGVTMESNKIFIERSCLGEPKLELVKITPKQKQEVRLRLGLINET